MKKLKYILPVLAVLVVLIAAKPVNDRTVAKYSGEQLFRGIFFFQGEIPNQIGAFVPIKEKLSALKPFEQMKEAQMVDNIVNTVKNLDPNYFVNLQSAVDSKDNYRIDEAMKSGAKLIYLSFSSSDQYKAYTQIPDDVIGKVDLSKYDLSKTEGLNAAVKDLTAKLKVAGKKSTSAGICDEANFCIAIFLVVALAVWDAVAAVNYAAVLNAAALAIVYAAVYAKTVFWPKEAEEMELASLQKETIINDIANLHYAGSSNTSSAALQTK